ncbi:MAG: hypothetical protein QM734_01015 [Cyclobacteriaceae bacterium]
MLKTAHYLFFLLLSFSLTAQVSEEDKFISSLNIGSDLPRGILAQRSIVLFEISYTKQELQEVQKYFQQAGIDAVSYIDIDYVLSGLEPSRMFSNYFNVRNIKFLIILSKINDQYQIIFTEYNGTKTFGDKSKTSWKFNHASLTELLRTVYRFAVSSERKINLLINDVPDTKIDIAFFKGKQDERFSPDVRIFKIAIQRLGNEEDDKALAELLRDNYNMKYDLVDPELTDAQLNDKNYRFVLRFIHTRGDVARDILGYDVGQTAGSLPTTYFAEGQAKIKTIRAKKIIYKYYLKNTEYGNIFLGTKWDADETWQDALKNHIAGMRSDLRF